jgi:hypothetical protein
MTDTAFITLRLGPGLTREQVQMLLDAPYEKPHRFKQVRRARYLAAVGVLEEDPSNKGLFRCTEAGQDVILAYKAKGWLP